MLLQQEFPWFSCSPMRSRVIVACMAEPTREVALRGPISHLGFFVCSTSRHIQIGVVAIVVSAVTKAAGEHAVCCLIGRAIAVGALELIVNSEIAIQVVVVVAAVAEAAGEESCALSAHSWLRCIPSVARHLGHTPVVIAVVVAAVAEAAGKVPSSVLVGV